MTESLWDSALPLGLGDGCKEKVEGALMLESFGGVFMGNMRVKNSSTWDHLQIFEGVDHELEGDGGEHEAHDARGEFHGDGVEPGGAARGKAQNEIADD